MKLDSCGGAGLESNVLLVVAERVPRKLGPVRVGGLTGRRAPMKQRQKGFSLIELLIVVAIILIIAAIPIPNLLRARMQANESSAVSSMHAVNTASISYSTLFPTVGFAPSLLALGDGASPPCPGNSSASCYLD